MDAGLTSVAPYAVSMAYRVRFVMDMNAREAMHVIELRTAPAGPSGLPAGVPADAHSSSPRSPDTGRLPTRCSCAIIRTSSSNGCRKNGGSKGSEPRHRIDAV